MKVLAIDTATDNCSAALWIDEKIETRERLLERGHAEHILLMVDELLRGAQVALTELAAIAFGRGPGAFTGVRLAASVTQGLAFGAALPVVPVSDLRALAQHALTRAPRCMRVLACLDARMQEVYFGCFERSAEGLAVAVGEEHVAPPSQVYLPETWSDLTRTEGSGPAGICAAGPGFIAYPALVGLLPRAFHGVQGELRPRAEDVVRLAVPEILAGRIYQAEQALPIYLRDDVTQSVRSSH
jgi:tRNA threonylcarbamoyladenosine biosynthesis protein TsaB